MPRYVVARRAQSDLREIARYTTMTWSSKQATRYIAQLQSCFNMLVENPEIGRRCDEVSPGVHRHEHGKHVIFYRIKPDGVRISRILHQQMVPLRTHFKS